MLSPFVTVWRILGCPCTVEIRAPLTSWMRSGELGYLEWKTFISDYWIDLLRVNWRNQLRKPLKQKFLTTVDMGITWYLWMLQTWGPNTVMGPLYCQCCSEQTLKNTGFCSTVAFRWLLFVCFPSHPKLDLKHTRFKHFQLLSIIDWLVRKEKTWMYLLCLSAFYRDQILAILLDLFQTRNVISSP